MQAVVTLCDLEAGMDMPHVDICNDVWHVDKYIYMYICVYLYIFTVHTVCRLYIFTYIYLYMVMGI